MNSETQKKKFYRRKKFFIPCLMLTALLLADIIVVCATHGNSSDIRIDRLGATDNMPRYVETISVLSINMAHGRGDGRNQIIQSNEVIFQKVEAIGKLISREKAHIAALQEADAASWWSGDYSHVQKVGKLGGMSSAIQGRHVDGLGLHYGAAIVSRLESSNARQFTFKRNLPTFSKGFVALSCEWPGDKDFVFEVISLHLDFASAKVRARQLDELSEFVNKSARPHIIMGDFNSDMEASSLAAFMEKMELSTWEKDNEAIITFPALAARLDWILISKDFEIVQQKLLSDLVSDHRIVKALIKRKRHIN